MNLNENQLKLLKWLGATILVIALGFLGYTYPLPQEPSTIEPLETLGITNFLGLQVDSNADTTTALTVNQTGTGTILDIQDNGTTVFSVADGGTVTQTGNPTVNGNQIITGTLDVGGTFNYGANDLYPIGFASSGQQAVYGTDTITGTLAVTHGLTTATFCLATLGEDPTSGAGDAAHVTTAVAANACTIKAWQDDFVTAATETDVTVHWLVIGTP